MPPRFNNGEIPILVSAIAYALGVNPRAAKYIIYKAPKMFT